MYFCLRIAGSSSDNVCLSLRLSVTVSQIIIKTAQNHDDDHNDDHDDNHNDDHDDNHNDDHDDDHCHYYDHNDDHDDDYYYDHEPDDDDDDDDHYDHDDHDEYVFKKSKRYQEKKRLFQNSIA